MYESPGGTGHGPFFMPVGASRHCTMNRPLTGSLPNAAMEMI